MNPSKGLLHTNASSSLLTEPRHVVSFQGRGSATCNNKEGPAVSPRKSPMPSSHDRIPRYIVPIFNYMFLSGEPKCPVIVRGLQHLYNEGFKLGTNQKRFARYRRGLYFSSVSRRSNDFARGSEQVLHHFTMAGHRPKRFEFNFL